MKNGIQIISILLIISLNNCIKLRSEYNAENLWKLILNYDDTMKTITNLNKVDTENHTKNNNVYIKENLQKVSFKSLDISNPDPTDPAAQLSNEMDNFVKTVNSEGQSVIKRNDFDEIKTYLNNFENQIFSYFSQKFFQNEDEKFYKIGIRVLKDPIKAIDYQQQEKLVSFKEVDPDEEPPKMYTNEGGALCTGAGNCFGKKILWNLY